jgi:hypothetical protein
MGDAIGRMEKSPEQQTSERRRYFRIDDTIALHHELLGEPEVVGREAALRNPRSATRTDLREVDKQLTRSIGKLKIQNPEFAEVAELLNAKLNVMKQTLGGRQIGGSVVGDVSISACGLSFSDGKQFAVGSKLYLELTLLPTDLEICTLAEVIGSNRGAMMASGRATWTSSACRMTTRNCSLVTLSAARAN